MYLEIGITILTVLHFICYYIIYYFENTLKIITQDKTYYNINSQLTKPKHLRYLNNEMFEPAKLRTAGQLKSKDGKMNLSSVNFLAQAKLCIST